MDENERWFRPHPGGCRSRLGKGEPVPKRGHELLGSPSSISSPKMARKFTPGRPCALCGEAIFRSQGPRPHDRRWRHSQCQPPSMPLDGELLALAREWAARLGAESDMKIEEAFRSLREHWRQLTKPRRPRFQLPDGVNEADDVNDWDFVGVHSGLSSGRGDLWERIAQAATGDPTSPAARAVQESYPLLDWEDPQQFIHGRVSDHIRLDEHDGLFSGTDAMRKWEAAGPPAS